MTEYMLFDNLGDTVGLFGLGVSNLGILSHLPNGKRVILRSEEKIAALPRSDCEICAVYEGEAAFNDPREDTLIFSPSVRRDRRELLPFRRSGIRFTSDCEQFFEKVTVPVFAVSGSDGKSTTVSLVSRLLSDRFGSCPAVGNIGEAMTPALLSGSRAYAAELSSFMLSYGRQRAFRAAVTNISENHLDWHRDFAEYTASKLSLIKSCKEPVLSYDDPISREYLLSGSVYGIFSHSESYSELRRSCSAQVYYTLEDYEIKRCGESFLSLEDIKRTDENHLKNLLCALTLCDGYVTRKWAAETAGGFSGLAHRAEMFWSREGIDFIDSSIDTTPTRTASTLQSLSRRVVLILGGRGKGLSYEPLTDPVGKFASAVIIAGENRREIAAVMPGDVDVYYADGLTEAVKLSVEMLKEGEALLLSPASASFDAFKNYKDRGEKFKRAVLSHFPIN